ncbi:hypothetical protein [Leuconostoc citreum]|uniref:hypothetical protein n=1 Tax=Leuconostoc citreum TaxID=33964 RepID=UPI0032DE846E
MTFDEAIEKIDNITSEINIRQEVINDIYGVVETLRKEYAPDIEMTEAEKQLIERFIFYGFSFTQFVDAINNGNEFETHHALYVEANECFKHRIVSDGYVLNERLLMQAWINTKTIKVIGENNDKATSGRNKD